MGWRERALERGPLPINGQTRSVFVAGRWARRKKKKDIGKWYDLVFVPLTSVPKEKNGELFEGLIFANIVNAI